MPKDRGRVGRIPAHVGDARVRIRGWFKALRKRRLAARASRPAVGKKSIVCPSLSAARESY